MVSVVLAAPAAARAQGKSDEQARQQFQLGVELYKDGEYAKAAVAFRTAHELKPHWRILYNLAQAENMSNRFAAALEAYARYLAEGGAEVPAERVAEVKAEIRRLNGLVGMIEFVGGEPGARVLVDREDRGVTPLSGPVFVDLGRHDVVVQLGGHRIVDQVVTVSGGQKVVVKVESGSAAAGSARVPESAQPLPETPPRTVEERSGPPDGGRGGEAPAEEPRRLWTWVAFGAGGAAAIGAAVTGGLALAKEQDIRDRCAGGVCPASLEGEADALDDLALTTNVLVGVAAAGVAAGAALFFLEPGAGGGAEVSLAPSAARGGGGLSLGGRF